MEFILKNNLSERSYFLSGKYHFFHRFCDSEFKNKWTGFWKVPKKYVEFFKIKINDKTLSHENCKILIYNNVSAAHFYKLDEIEVKETIFVPSKKPSLVIILSLTNKKDEELIANIEFEVGINIREKDEDWHNRTYSLKVEGRNVIVNSEKGCVAFSSFPKGELNVIPEYKNVDNIERWFTPGKYNIKIAIAKKSVADVIFVISVDENEGSALFNLDETFKNLTEFIKESEKKVVGIKSKSFIDTNIEFLHDVFIQSAIQLTSLFKETKFGSGIITGYPSRFDFIGKNVLWSVLGLVDIGQFEMSKRCLDTFIKYFKNRQLPSRIDFQENVLYESFISSTIFPISLEKYVRISGDLDFLREKLEYIKKTFEFLGTKETESGFIKDISSTKLDDIERGETYIELQTFYIKSLRSMSNLLRMLKERDYKKYEKKATSIERKIEFFWTGEFYKDSLEKDFFTLSPVFLNFFDLKFRCKNSLDFINKNFKLDFGFSFVPKNSSIYSPEKTNLSCQSWILPLVSSLELKCGKIESALKIFKLSYSIINRNSVGCLPSSWNPENGNLIESQNPVLSNASSYSSYILMIEEWIAGIRPNATTNSIIITSHIPNNSYIRRIKKIGNDTVDIKIEKVKNKLNVSYKSKSKIKYSILKKPI